MDCSTTNTACLYCRRQGQRREAIENSLEGEETPKRDGTDGPKPTFLVIAWMIETPTQATKPEYRYLLRGGYRGSSGPTIFFMFFQSGARRHRHSPRNYCLTWRNSQG